MPFGSTLARAKFQGPGKSHYKSAGLGCIVTSHIGKAMWPGTHAGYFLESLNPIKTFRQSTLSFSYSGSDFLDLGLQGVKLPSNGPQNSADTTPKAAPFTPVALGGKTTHQLSR